VAEAEGVASVAGRRRQETLNPTKEIFDVSGAADFNDDATKPSPRAAPSLTSAGKWQRCRQNGTAPASELLCRGQSLTGTESPSQSPHPDADIILKTHLALVRGITRKHAQLR
jgi:hypothetical protein